MIAKTDLFHLITAAAEIDETFNVGELPETDWTDINKCHDWRNYVDPAIRVCWENIGIEGMAAVYITAAKMAAVEEWP